jgi:hypothetical protein
MAAIWIPGVDKLNKVNNYFESSLVVWPRQNANNFMPQNTDNYGDTVKTIFAVFDV